MYRIRFQKLQVLSLKQEYWEKRLSYYWWWRQQTETFSALLAICVGNSPVPGEFPAQRPVTRSFDAFFELHPNKRLSQQWWGWWFETLSCPLWRHRNGYYSLIYPYLTYCCQVWGATYLYNIEILNMLQKRVIRIICSETKHAHTEPLFKELKILNIYIITY